MLPVALHTSLYAVLPSRAQQRATLLPNTERGLGDFGPWQEGQRMPTHSHQLNLAARFSEVCQGGSLMSF